MVKRVNVILCHNLRNKEISIKDGWIKKEELTVLTLGPPYKPWSLFRLLLEKNKQCLVTTIVTWVCAITRTISPRKNHGGEEERKCPFRDLASPTEDLCKRSHLHVSTSAGWVLQFPATNFLQTSPPTVSPQWPRNSRMETTAFQKRMSRTNWEPKTHQSEPLRFRPTLPFQLTKTSQQINKKKTTFPEPEWFHFPSLFLRLCGHFSSLGAKTPSHTSFYLAVNRISL